MSLHGLAIREIIRQIEIRGPKSSVFNQSINQSIEVALVAELLQG